MSAPKHTPEPWPEAADHPSYFPFASENGHIRMDRVDYERARACVNACAGTSTDELVATGIDMGMPAMDAAKGALIILTNQRDELAAALHDMAEFGLRHDLIPCRDMASRETVDKFWRHYLAGADDLLRKRARAALAKVGA